MVSLSPGPPRSTSPDPRRAWNIPAIVFDGIDDAAQDLFWITAHEIGHSWFPMIVGFNERRDAWMDEGFNTFIDVYESDEFNHGEYTARSATANMRRGGGNPVDEILPILADPDAPPILSRADTILEKYRHPVTYFKSALGLVLLREQILGPERFDPAFRRFIADWAFKHPTPADFFRAMESERRRGPRLVLARLVLQQLAARPRGDRHHAVPGRAPHSRARSSRSKSRDKLVHAGDALRVTFADGTQPRRPAPGRDLDPPGVDRRAGDCEFADRSRGARSRPQNPGQGPLE